MKKISWRTVLMSLSIPITVGVTVVIVTLIAGLIITVSGLNYMQEETSVSKLAYIQNHFKNREDLLKSALLSMNDNFTEIYAAAEEQDWEAVDVELQWMKRVQKLTGYIYASLDGKVRTTSGDGYVSDIFSDIFRKTVANPDSMVLGASRLLTDGGFVTFGSIVMKHDETPLGVCLFYNFNSTQQEELDDFREMTGMDAYVFIDDKCVSYSQSDSAIIAADLTLDRQAQEKAKANNGGWAGHITFAGEDKYGFYLSFPSYSGKEVALLVMPYPDSHVRILKTNQRNMLLIAAVIFAICFTWVIRSVNSRILKPVKRLVEGIDQVATGDLTTYIEPKGADEFVGMAHSVNEMTLKIKGVLKPIMESAEAINENTKVLSQTALIMSDGSMRQAASLEEVSSAMVEMGSNVQLSMENAVNTNKLAQEVSGLVSELAEASSTSYKAILNINKNVNDIKELAKQTNILSLNASVEAARAGKQGLGFSIVAREIGKLAVDTHKNVTAINMTADESINITKLTNERVTNVTPKIEKVVSLVDEISGSSIEQNRGVEQVNVAIAELNQVTQETAAHAEEVAENAEEINKMVTDMNIAIKIFKV